MSSQSQLPTPPQPPQLTEEPERNVVHLSKATASPNGIDLKEALAILSSRSDENQDPQHHHSAGCGCSRKPNQAVMGMGQTIDLLAPASPSQDGVGEARILSEEDRQEEKDKIKRQREERLQRIEQELQSMSDVELLQAVLKAQEDRVATYRFYEAGLKVVLDTGNMTSYPNTCAKATASFSVLSDTIKSIRTILKARRRTDWTQCVDLLQQHEQTKLQLTAASHLEQIRAQQEADPKTANLLQQGVTNLHQKIQTCVEDIHEVLDEIRCAILDDHED